MSQPPPSPTTTPDPAGPALPAAELRTPRLLLRASRPGQAAAVCDFQRRNQDHLAPWEPTRPAHYWTLDATTQRLAQEAESFARGQLWRYWITRPEQPARVIGQCQVSQVARGPFQNAMLGYSLDVQCLGQGLMHEALARLVAEVFGHHVWLHRLQAAVRPENQASRRVLERLGFQREGLSPRYLFIAGAWRDHETFALLNPAWPVGQPPRA